MSYIDLFRMSLSSLWRRKLRTVLTVLGVVVGTASIVVMISIGLGLDRMNMQQIEQFGGLTTITVYPNEGGYSYTSYAGGGVMIESAGSGEESNEPVRIDDEMMEVLAQIEHVEIASPVLTCSVVAKQGVWEGEYLSVRGMSQEALESMDFDLAEGTLPTSDTELQFLYGNTVITSFYNGKTNKDYWETGELAEVDYVNSPMFIIFDQDAYWNNKYGGTDENGAPIPAPKKYIVPTCGVMAGGAEDYTNSNGGYIFCNVDALKTQLTKAFKGKAIPGQPTNSAGKPYKEIYYNEAYIRVDDMDHVMEVQDQIRALGLQPTSNVEWMNQAKESSRSIQMALGGIGAVSLFVAAIGIANTMMMSIYERTKEIGVMKVLGCDLSAIRNMFLTEAGFIGLIGGAVGLILSFCISGVINFLTSSMYMEGSYGLSYIPPYLVLLALVFAVVIGMLAGLFPALRAMRLSPLAAIRNE